MKRMIYIFSGVIIIAILGVLLYQSHLTKKKEQAERIRQFYQGEKPEEWVFGKTETELRALFGDVRRAGGLIKHLHPYRPPKGHDLLLLNDAYIVFELKDGKVIKVHKIRG